MLAGLAGCSIGASRPTDHTTRIAVQRIKAISSVYTRSGQTQTRSDSSFSMGSSPAAIRRSLRTPSRIAYHVKKTTRKMSATIGTLSGLTTIRRKFSSNRPNAKNTARKPIMP